MTDILNDLANMGNLDMAATCAEVVGLLALAIMITTSMWGEVRSGRLRNVAARSARG